MERLIVQLPRGRTAVVQFDPATGRVTTNHAGLHSTLFAQGVKEFGGDWVLPDQGRAFFTAVFDHLFLSGYAVRWLRSVRRSDLASHHVE